MLKTKPTVFTEQDIQELHIKYNSPILLIKPTGGFWNSKLDLVINPCLKDYKFTNYFGAMQAFQEIEMYLGGVMCCNEEDGNVSISDKDRIKQKGFNEWSFRKLPTKKK